MKQTKKSSLLSASLLRNSMERLTLFLIPPYSKILLVVKKTLGFERLVFVVVFAYTLSFICLLILWDKR